ncbi:MAG: insulinase family protein [Chlamydiota bacterium]|nr:insulinase family protein [Chlamydiota bacterium]
MRILRYILIMATLTSPLTSTTSIENKATLPILTPSLSEMKQEKIRLDNGLEAILISDPNTDKSGAMLSVQVGSWEDPIEHPGIAHFLEHMLFLGTKKYPNEGDYHQYIRDNGGQANAFTANHITSYMFAIDNNAFDGALDRFSEFFKEPLFNPSGVSRELNAIDQEYEKNVENDDIREHYVYKALLKKDHPYYRFNMGNSDTLKNVTREELQQWYTEHYSANLMRLMVISTDPIDKLKEQVVDNFSGIKNYNRKRFTTTERYTPKEALGKLTVVEPIKDSRTLSIVWELPENFVNMKQVKPDSIICHVIGHEGEESLLAQLKRENLAYSLSCGASNSGAINSDMYIEIGLTDKGFHEYLTVAERVFQALNNFKAKGLPKYLFDEVQASQKLKYQYRAREDVFTSLMKHGMTINDESIETYPEYTKIVQEYAPEKVQDLLAYLTPQNAVFLLKAPSGTSNFTPDTMEKWLEVPYSTHSFSDGTLERWELITPHENINLPSPNPFLPESLKIVASESTSLAQDTLLPQPTLLEDSNEGTFYYCLDSKFQEPKVSWFVEVKTPTITIEDPSSLVMGDLYVKLLKDNLKKYSYPAEMAGLSYQISREDNGIGIAIIGFSDKAEKLLSIILKTIGNGTLNLNDFKTYKETLLKKYQNFTKESPLQQT